MKIAYFSCYRDGTGYSHAGINNILAMKKTGLNVVARPINLTPLKNTGINFDIIEAEKNTLDNIDIVIQHALPHMFEYKGGVKNIGYFDWETTNFNRSTWTQSLNLMDEIWVPSIQNKYACIHSKIKKRIRIIPHSCDINKYNKTIEPLNIPQFKDKCIFYFIGEMTRRKNLSGLIRSYYSAFSGKDNVGLIIKTNIPGKSSEEAKEYIKGFIEEIKNNIHIYSNHHNYPPILIITDYLSEDKLDQIHKLGNIFVSISHGEGGCLPAFDAMGFGNPVIASNWGFFPELLYEQADEYFNLLTQEFKDTGEIDCGWLVPGQLTHCFGMKGGIQEIYTGTEQWFDPNLLELSKIMRNSYYEWQTGLLNKKGIAAKNRIIKFSHENIGHLIKEALEDK